ncbi:MAG: DsrE family protein [Rhodoferax sp.]|jgi:sulfur relay (sulfurtransferase) complex TusBCD TusD component (DsrE family)|nr:DsrE family protein [Rhodoferax sp.]
MKFLASLLMAFVMALGGTAQLAYAGDSDPLFVNLTTDDVHRASMGITFGKTQLERGHPLTIFLNDKGVLVGSTANAAKYPQHQKMLTDAIAKGASVLVCPMCMKHFGIKEADLLPGLKVGNPELTGAAVFKDNTKSLTW